MLHRVGPTAGGSPACGRTQQRPLFEEHVDDVQGRRIVGRAGPLAFQPLEGGAERYGLREERQRVESPRAHVEDGTVGRIEQDVASGVESRAHLRCQLQERLRKEKVRFMQGARSSSPLRGGRPQLHYGSAQLGRSAADPQPEGQATTELLSDQGRSRARQVTSSEMFQLDRYISQLVVSDVLQRVRCQRFTPDAGPNRRV